MEIASAEFAARRCVVQRGLLDSSRLTFLYRYALEQAASGRLMLGGDALVPGTPCNYADPTMEMLLEDLCPTIEKTTGLRLFPTYSFSRIYKNGDVLNRHRDRPSCEVSATLSLGYDPDDPWPIFLESPIGATSIALNPGDALIYRGCECYHWREAYTGKHAAQVFLHYVDQNGPNAEWRFDKRSCIPSVGQMIKGGMSETIKSALSESDKIRRCGYQKWLSEREGSQ